PPRTLHWLEHAGIRPGETAPCSDVPRPPGSACPSSLRKARPNHQVGRGERRRLVPRVSRRCSRAVSSLSREQEWPPRSLRSAFGSWDQGFESNGSPENRLLSCRTVAGEMRAGNRDLFTSIHILFTNHKQGRPTVCNIRNLAALWKVSHNEKPLTVSRSDQASIATAKPQNCGVARRHHRLCRAKSGKEARLVISSLPCKSSSGFRIKRPSNVRSAS